MRASGAATLVAAIAACGRNPPPPDAAVGPTPARTVPLASVYLLLQSEAPPPDTAVTLSAGTPRHILFRTAHEDRDVVADLYFGEQAFQAPAGTPVPVTVRPAPGSYGLVLTAGAPFARGGEITFKYAVQFLQPPESVQKYPNHVLFEHALVVGRLAADGQIDLLPSIRPATDNLRAPADSPGTYVVAAPR